MKELNKEMYEAFNPMDPLDLAIMTDPEFDHEVDELEKYTEAAAHGRDSVLSEAYETGIGNDQFQAEDDASEDAEDYSTAEMELLAGDFGNPINSVDGLEFTSAE